MPSCQGSYRLPNLVPVTFQVLLDKPGRAGSVTGPQSLQQRFVIVDPVLRPAMLLAHDLHEDRERFGEDGIHAASGGRRFLGWTVGRHWLLSKDAGRPE